MTENFDAEKYHKYHSGEFYEPSVRTPDFPFLKDDNIVHSKLKLIGKLKGYDKSGRDILAVITLQNGIDIKDNFVNWQLQESN